MVTPQAILNAIGKQVNQMTLNNWQPPQPMSDPIVDQINKIRIDNKLSPLTINQKLNNSATYKALNQVNQGYWDHQEPSGAHSWDEIKNAGYQYQSAGENLARNFPDDSSMMQGWMNSPTHKANILNPDFKEIGVGRHNGYVVTHFGE